MSIGTADPWHGYQFFLLDRARKRPTSFAALHPQVISSQTGLQDSVSQATKDSFWISYESDLTDSLVKNISTGHARLGLGLFAHPLDAQAIPALASLFRRIDFAAAGGFLPPEELAEVLEAKNRADLFLGGIVNKATQTITFWRGDLEPLVVPFSTFEPSGDGTTPDFDKFSVIDCGQTVQLGDYEAAVDAILYEHAPTYRRAVSKKRLQEDQSFGASLRRLRMQRGLSRKDFEPAVSEKTLARIEQGKVSRVQPKTLQAIAARLSVEPQEIASF